MNIRIPKSSAMILLMMVLFQVGSFFFIGNVSSIDRYYFIFLEIFYSLSLFVFGITIFINKLDFLSTVILVSVISFLFFFIMPIIDLISKNYFFFGIDARSGLEKGTIFFFIGYLTYVLFFQLFISKLGQTKYKSFSINKNGTSKKMVRFNSFLWIFIFSSSLFNLLRSSLVVQSIGLANGDNTILASNGILSIMGYGLVVPWMYIMILSNSKLLKIFITFGTFILFFLNGYRFIIIIMVVGYLSFTLIKIGKRPRVSQIVIFIGMISLLMAIIGYVRNFLRGGNTVNIDLFSLNEIYYTLQGNFGIYKAFYIMVSKMPEMVSFTHGTQILYTFILFIPRAIWKTKPDTPLRGLIYPLLGDYALQAGTAWPNIGEYYSEFGLIGIVLGYTFFSFLSFSIDKIRSTSSTLDIKIFGSVLYGTMFQLTIRGYTPSNFWLVFVFFVLVVLNNLYRKRILQGEELLCVTPE